MSGLIGIIVTIVLAVILIKVTFKLLGIAIAIGLGVLAYFVAEKFFGKRV
jgi:putative flippase GtrA